MNALEAAACGPPTLDSSYRSASLLNAVIDALCFAPPTLVAARGTANSAVPTEDGVTC
jgi:hypothetical protein